MKVVCIIDIAKQEQLTTTHTAIRIAKSISNMLNYLIVLRLQTEINIIHIQDAKQSATARPSIFRPKYSFGDTSKQN